MYKIICKHKGSADVAVPFHVNIVRILPACLEHRYHIISVIYLHFYIVLFIPIPNVQLLKP